jgi:hypothetical protein
MRVAKSAALGVLLLGLAAAPAVAGGWQGGYDEGREARAPADAAWAGDHARWQEWERSSSDFRVTGRHGCTADIGCAEGGEVALPMSFFADIGGVGGFMESFDSGGGGGGFAVAGAGAQAFASASASARVSVRFHGRIHGGGHKGGCGCK